MGINYGPPPIVSKGLIYCVDTIDKHSYPGSGTSVTDLVGGRTATLTNGPTFNTSGYFDFDGSNDYMDMGFRPTNAICSNGFAWGYWFNWDAIGGNKIQGIIDNPGGDNGRIYMGPYNGNFMTGCGNTFDTNTGSISTGNWFYCVMSFDGSSTCRTYLNGSLSDTMTSITFSIAGNRNMMWGAANNDGNILYNNNGKGALTHFYSKELLASEVSQNFNAHRARFGV